jgi:hypothetical protein
MFILFLVRVIVFTGFGKIFYLGVVSTIPITLDVEY